jgi:phosphomethylpyrimidine synthase
LTVHVDKPKSLPQSVTTGPIHGSRKVYAAPKDRADIRVPFREIVLTDANEPPARVYDPSGPYPEKDAAIDLGRGLPLVREAWIASRGYASIEGPAQVLLLIER